MILFIYVFCIATPIGAYVGWLTGALIKRVLHENRPRVILDVVIGAIGFLVTSFISFPYVKSYTEEKWMNGQLVYKKTTGFSGLFLLYGLLGTAILVIVVHLGIKAWRKLDRTGHVAKTDAE